MTLTLRIVLLFIAIVTGAWILYKINKSKLKMEDAIFWILAAILLLIMGIFPKVAYFMAVLLGIEAPSNFVFAFLIFVCLMKILSLSIKVSQLEEKLSIMADESAIQLYEMESERMEETSD